MEDRALIPDALPPNPLGDRLEAICARLREVPDFETGPGRDWYLDIAERIVRRTVGMLTPLEKTDDLLLSRLAGAGLLLTGAGRLEDLVELVASAVDVVTCRLAQPRDDQPAGFVADVCAREVAMAVESIGLRVEPWRMQAWRARLSRIHPHDLYRRVPGAQAIAPMLWGLQWVVAEQAKRRAGICVGADEASALELQRQRRQFTAGGLYRDAAGGLESDLSAREACAWLLFEGYRGPLWAELTELCRRGALLSLCFQRPPGDADGETEASQAQALAAVIAEDQATRWALQGNRAVAGAFKRQAQLSALAAERAVAGGSVAPAEALAVAGALCRAYILADDTIAPAPLPSEALGYVLQSEAEFGRVFGCCAGTAVEVSLRGDLAGCALAMGGDMPMLVGRLEPPGCALAAIGPEWVPGDGQPESLATCGGRVIRTRLRISQQATSRVAFTVSYELADGTRVRERYALGPSKLHLEAQVEPPPRCLRLLIALPSGTGRPGARTAIREGSAEIRSDAGACALVTATGSAMFLRISGHGEAAGGPSAILVIEQAGGRADITITARGSLP